MQIRKRSWETRSKSNKNDGLMGRQAGAPNQDRQLPTQIRCQVKIHTAGDFSIVYSDR